MAEVKLVGWNEMFCCDFYRYASIRCVEAEAGDAAGGVAGSASE